MGNFPIIKIADFCSVMSINMTLQKWAIFIMGVFGDNLCRLSDQAEIYKKKVDTHPKSFRSKK